MTKEIIIIADYTSEELLNIDELGEISGLMPNELKEMIAYDILIPVGSEPDEWSFDMIQLKRLQTALRLRRDLEINLAGIALVLQLKQELEELRAKADLLGRHLLKNEE